MASSSPRQQVAADRIAQDPVRARYESDPYSWALEQARLIRAGRFSEIDVENVAEEIESVGKSERSSLESHLARVMQHLLKWDHQPEKRSPSWWHSVNAHRVRAGLVLRNNPGLKSSATDVVAQAYDVAVADAMADTRLPRSAFPEACPYTLVDVMERVLDPVEGSSWG